MSERLDLQSILDSDDEGLLDTPKKPAKVTSTDRLERSFLEIVEFYREHQRVPSSTTREIPERKLGARLDGILANDQKIEALQHLDECDLLKAPEAPESLEELLESDDLDLLEDELGILDTSKLPQRRHQNTPESVAKRVRAEDFEKFEPLFKQKHAELADGGARLVAFPGRQSIVEGKFFVLNGVMLFIAEVAAPEYRETTVRVNRRERLRCVFENGTESSMYRQSLSIRLSEGEGHVVVPTDHGEILADDQATGYIYVLKSLSDDPQIRSIENLYKIGFTRGPVEKRVVSAKNQPTYLMAPVEIVATYRTYNLRTSALEHLLHRVFADVKLDVSLVGRDGLAYEPAEWFVVPLPVINRAIELITAGGIVDFAYDAIAGALRHRPERQ